MHRFALACALLALALLGSALTLSACQYHYTPRDADRSDDASQSPAPIVPPDDPTEDDAPTDVPPPTAPVLPTPPPQAPESAPDTSPSQPPASPEMPPDTPDDPDEDPPPPAEPDSDDAALVSSEAALVSSDAFISANDRLTPVWDTASHYGRSNYPAFLYGMPKTGTPASTHVVSFGVDGVLTIELIGYRPVNDYGPDFTIFENPFVDAATGAIYAERARISVSEDGLTYIDFPCDALDPEEHYDGCAGVALVHATENPLDPTVSGGDTFDLAEIGLARVRFIRITDLTSLTCVSGDPTYPRCLDAYQAGFDLDALAIVNGVNE